MRPRLVNARQCRGHLARSGRLVRPDPAPGIGREVAGDGMAAAGFGSPGAGGGTRLSDPTAATWIRDGTDRISPSRGPASLSSPLLAGREALLEGGVLGLSGAINEKSADQPCSRPCDCSEPGIPADGAKNGADAGARSGAGQRPLLSWGHIGASSGRQNDGREHQ